MWRRGSGSNGGFFSPSWTGVAWLCEKLGVDGGLTYAKALAREVDELVTWVERHDARIDLHREGSLHGQAGEWQEPPSQEGLAILAARGLADKVRVVDASEARSFADSPRFIGGTFIPDVAVIQPAKLARELRRILLGRGVRIYEMTPMQRLEAGRPLRVVAPAGQVAAAGVVVANGAWAVSQRRFRRAFAVCTNSMVVTEPIPGLAAKIGWARHVGIADSREMVHYVRRTEDDRIAIGGGAMGVVYGDHIRGRVLQSTNRAEVAARGLLWLFPQLEGVRFDAAWSSPMDMTPTFLPFFASAPSRSLHAGLGFSGHGLTSTKLGGKILASLVQHADDEWSRMPVVGPPRASVPPEPVRWPLVSVVAWARRSGNDAGAQGKPRDRLRGLIGRAYGAYSARDESEDGLGRGNHPR